MQVQKQPPVVPGRQGRHRHRKYHHVEDERVQRGIDHPGCLAATGQDKGELADLEHGQAQSQGHHG